MYIILYVYYIICILYYIGLYNTHSLVWSSLVYYNGFDRSRSSKSPTDESGEGGCHERQGQTSPGVVLVGTKRLAF